MRQADTDTMMFVRPDIQTVCMGQAASAAAVLLAAGTKGKRLALQATLRELTARTIADALRRTALLGTCLVEHDVTQWCAQQRRQPEA